MTTYSLNGHTLIGVIVPEDCGWKNFRIAYIPAPMLEFEIGDDVKWRPLPPEGNWSIIGSGLAGQIKEEEAKGLVELAVHMEDHERLVKDGWWNYNSGDPLDTAVASLHSWLLANGLEKNCVLLKKI